MRVATLVPVIAWLVLSAPSAWCDERQAVLAVFTDSNPPLAYQDQDHQFHGLTVEILDLVAKDAEIGVVYQELPWNRAYQVVADHPGTCLIGIGRTREREEKFSWVGPFVQGGVALFALKRRHIHLADLQDAIEKGYRVGVAKSDVAAGVIDRYPGLAREDIPLQKLGPQMLAHERFDLWASGQILGLYRLKAEGVDAETVLRVDSIDVALGCNPNTDPGILAKLQARFDRLAGSAPFHKILREYLPTE